MKRPIPTSAYVEHFDSELDHHRAWLQAVLEQLVSHDPQALKEGSTLRRLWIQHQEDTLAAATGSRYPNPLVDVPCFQQRDSAQRSQRDRSCFSSSCAMLLEALKPGTLPGANGDDAYLGVVQRYCRRWMVEPIGGGAYLFPPGREWARARLSQIIPGVR